MDVASLKKKLTNAVFYGNGRLRRAVGWAPKSRGVAQALAPAYLLAAKALKSWAPPKMNMERAHLRRFDVDLSAPGCVRWREGMAPDWAVLPEPVETPVAAAKPARKTSRRKAETLKAA